MFFLVRPGSFGLTHGKLNMDTYYAILEDSGLPMLWLFYGFDSWYFQHDNISYHVAMATMDLYVTLGIIK